MRGSRIVVLSILLAACSPPQQHKAAPEATSVVEAAGDGLVAAASQNAEAFSSAPPPPAALPSDASPSARALAGTPLLAYSYGVGFELPTESVPVMLGRHQAACGAAGAARCQIINSSTQRYGEDNLAGHLEMRAEPRWLEAFRASLANDAKQAGGRISASSTNSQDLTRDIVDTSATLAAQRTLRDRLQKLLESRPGKLSDLLEAERELARVQGELNSLTSNLAVMQARVATSLLTLEYSSRPSAIGSDAWLPLRDAVNGFFGSMVAGFAFLIRLLAALLPFAIVLGPLAWLGARAWGQRRTARAKVQHAAS